MIMISLHIASITGSPAWFERKLLDRLTFTLTLWMCSGMRCGREEESMTRRLDNTERCCLFDAQGMESIGSSFAGFGKGRIRSMPRSL